MASTNLEPSVLSLATILEKIAAITLQIQQCYDLTDILQWAIDDARNQLQTDRVLIGQLHENQLIIVTLESTNGEGISTLGQAIAPPAPENTWFQLCQQGKTVAIPDMLDGTLAPNQTAPLVPLQVQAMLAVPIMHKGCLWGILMAHHCRRAHQWSSLDVQYIQQMALQLGVAVQQASFQQEHQRLATELKQRPVVCNQPAYEEAEARLRRYERIVSATPDGVALVDHNYIYQAVNHTYLAWTKQSSNEVIGRSVRDVLGRNSFITFVKPRLDRCLAGDPIQLFEDWQDDEAGQRRYFRTTYTPYTELDGTISGVVVNIHDLTDLKKTEVALREQQQFTEQIAESTLAILYVYDLTEQRNIYCNQQIETVLGYSSAEIKAMGDALFPLLIHPDDLPRVIANQQELYQLQGNEFVEIEYRMRHKSGSYRWLLSRGKVLNRNPNGEPKHIVGVGIDITAFKESQAVIHQQTERERLLMAIAQNIRQTLDLDQILQTAVTEVRQLLQVDRVVIYRFNPDWSGTIIAESVETGWDSILGKQISSFCLVETQGQLYREGQITAIDDVQTASLDASSLTILAEIQVQAIVVVPILQNDQLWGLLAAHHCQRPRHWEPFEIALQQQLATQVAIALQQSELFRQVQTFNTELELQVQERTAQLQQALEFEALLKRITDRVRDSLDEHQILQTAVQELANGLGVKCCDAALYDLEQRTSTIAYESLQAGVNPAKGLVFSIDSSGGIHDQLLRGECLQFCLTQQWPNSYRSTIDPQAAILSCPFQDEQGVIGDMWLFKPQQEYFSDAEVRLVQQVANHCAIALRQSRLYQKSQAQVQELERLNHLKDDFLSTVSHELRTPMSNIKMAIQMLEVIKSQDQSGPNNAETSVVDRSERYFKILQSECEREISLINDLLDLTRLDAGVEPLNPVTVNLQDWLPQVLEPFKQRMQRQQQQLQVSLPANTPPIGTDLSCLERILAELVNNACKYTPATGQISVLVKVKPAAKKIAFTWLVITVANSGIEIPSHELERIFDKFYRIPNNDPWKHGGTGLGLALVKRLVERLKGDITATSHHQQTRFTVKIPSLK